MSIEHRVNPKTGKDQYKCRYRWRDENGKLRSSDTGWFDTIVKAQKNADELKNAKENDSALRITNKREAYIKTVFGEIYLKELDQKAHRETTDRISNDYNKWNRARSVAKYYTPEEIKYTKINEITPRIFRIWADYINEAGLAGTTTHRYIECLFHFNRWLADKGYYTDSTLEMSIDTMLARFSTKSRKVGARKDRYLMGMDDVETITTYWKHKGIGIFYNFYHYTLWYTLAYTGMRCEEARALQWKNVDLRPEERIIYIKNAIAESEKEANAIARIKKGIYYTKTEDSERGIPIFDIIYQLLVDYKESYRYECGKDDIEECFVFPHLNHDHTFDFNMFAGRGIWLSKLKETINECGIPNTDIGMFRHSCATFLVAPEPDGLGFTEAQVMSFFGHITTNMLSQVYAKLQQKQKTSRLKKTFVGYYTPDENKKDIAVNAAKERMIERVGGDNEKEQLEARRQRILAQIIDVVCYQRRDTYYYKKEDEPIIEELKGKFNIAFICNE